MEFIKSTGIILKGFKKAIILLSRLTLQKMKLKKSCL